MNNQPIIDLLPQNKSDIKRAEDLMKYSYEDLRDQIPKLLEWLQDINWPVARPVATYLKSIQTSITAELRFILQNTDDAVWKYGLLQTFGPTTQSPDIKKEILRMANSPTTNEIDEEVNLLAMELIQDNNWVL